MNKKIELKLIEVIDYLKSRKDIILVVLFGSYSRGEFSQKHSDIDLYVMLDKDYSEEFNEERFHYENKLLGKVNEIGKDINFEVTLDYKNLDPNAKLLRYNIFKEGKILYSKNKLPLFLFKDDLGCIELVLIEMNLTKLTPPQRMSFKRSMTNKYKNEVFYINGSTIIIKKSFMQEFEDICLNKNIEFQIIKDFITNLD